MLKLREDHGHWTAFHPASGLKVTASPGPERLLKTAAPELVDISVTDFCSIGCAFCYRGSTTQGQHATLEHLDWIARQLARAGVFEVALGGGEITQHPHFLEVLRTFQRRGLTVNFTTRQPQFVARYWPDLQHLIGALAISSGSAGELRRQHANLPGVPPERVNVHIVLGTLRRAPFLDLLRTAHALGHRVTLLGYKTSGRGAHYPPIPHDWWLEGLPLARELGLPLSIDTTLAAQDEARLLSAGVDPVLFHTREGQYSAFIDAVQMTLAASSYDGPSFPLTEDWLTQLWPHLKQLESP